MKRLVLTLLFLCVLLGACRRTSHRNLSTVFRFEKGGAWDSNLEGAILDGFQFPVGNDAFPFTVDLDHIGNDKYRVHMRSVVDFHLYEPFLNLPVGMFAYDLDRMDGQTGDYYPQQGANRFGHFWFWGGDFLPIPGHGMTEISFSFWLVPRNGPLNTATEADLTWEAYLVSQAGLPGLTPAVAAYHGTATVAIRLED